MQAKFFAGNRVALLLSSGTSLRITLDPIHNHGESGIDDTLEVARRPSDKRAEDPPPRGNVNGIDIPDVAVSNGGRSPSL